MAVVALISTMNTRTTPSYPHIYERLMKVDQDGAMAAAELSHYQALSNLYRSQRRYVLYINSPPFNTNSTAFESECGVSFPADRSSCRPSLQRTGVQRHCTVRWIGHYKSVESEIQTPVTIANSGDSKWLYCRSLV